VLDGVGGILENLKEIKQRYEANAKQCEYKDYETQDLLHELELGTLNAAQRIKLFNELHKVRQERRKVKDENELLSSVYHLLSVKYPKLINDLEYCCREIKRARKEMETRQYFPRVRGDLTISDITQTEALVRKFEKRRVGRIGGNQ